MGINPVTAAQTPLILPATGQAPATGAAQPDATMDSITITTPLQQGQPNDGYDDLVLQTRVTDQKLATVTDAVDRMKGALEGVVKNFPPFPPDSSERQKLLMSYISIKKELVKMVIPPPPPPLYEKVKHMWEKLFSADSPGLPQLPHEMGRGTQDTEIRSTLIQLKYIQRSISSIRATIRQSLSES